MPNHMILPILIIVGLSLFSVFADFFIKLAGNKVSPQVDWKYFIIGSVMYGLTAFGWLYVMRHVKFATLGVFYALSTVFFLTIFGAIFLKESLSIREIMGISLGVISILLLARFA
jgi:drug/metabolite transporter (DMT)-like permease